MEPDAGSIKNAVKRGKRREIDFAKYPERRIALMFLYVGWEFDGMEYAKWNRCGRTDKNVSGFRQVGSCIVRSTDVNGAYVYWPDDAPAEETRINTTDELNFPKILNGNLPSSVRILAWAPVLADFNARFNCSQRVYNYLFPRANLDLKQMRIACQDLVGVHDFRNFCQIDNSKSRLETSYVREIHSIDIHEFPAGDDAKQHSAYQMCQLTVKGSGFLWHQIRFIVNLLHEVGQGNEKPTIITELLNIVKYPARPQYRMACDLPLCFFDCSYNTDVDWVFDTSVLHEVYTRLERMWIELRVKTERIKSMMDAIASMPVASEMRVGSGLCQFICNNAPKNHIPILKRSCCGSLDERIAKTLQKRTHIDSDSNQP